MFLPPVIMEIRSKFDGVYRDLTRLETTTQATLRSTAATAEAGAVKARATSAAATARAEKATARVVREESAAAIRAAQVAAYAQAEAEAAAAAAASATAAANAAGAASAASASRARTAMMAMARVGKAAFLGVAAATAIVAVAGVHMGMDFQKATRQLVTGAGESATALNGVRAGLLGLSGQVGMTPKVLAEGMFAVESAGFRGAAGVQVLAAAAKGATANGSELATTTDALTTIMINYHMGASGAVTAMNMLTAAAAASKVNVQDMAASMSSVLPIAAASKISFAEVGGAIATMTNSGMSAEQSTQNLANAIRSLQSPNLQAQKEMQRLGLSSNDVAKNLGQRGLTGTLDILTQAIGRHTKGGDVLIATFNKSKQAAGAMATMLKSMPPDVQKLAQSYNQGKISVKDYQLALKDLPGNQAVLGRQFQTLADRSNGFNDLLKQGGPAAQTYTAALGKMMGGATGLNVALMLTGKNMGAFKSSVAGVDAAAKSGSKEVTGWATAQKDLSIQLAQLKGSITALIVKIGMGLIPVLSKVLRFFTEHTTVTKTLAAAVGGVLLVAIAAYTVAMASAAVATIAATWPILAVIAAIAALGAAVYLIATHWSQVWGFMTSKVGIAIGIVIALLLPIPTLLIALVAGVILLVKNWNTVWNAIKNTTLTVWNAIKTATSATVNAVVAAVQWLGNAIVTAWNATIAAGTAVIRWFVALPGMVMSAVAALPGWLWGFFTRGLNNLAYAVGFAIGSIIRLFIWMVTTTISTVQALPGVIVGIFSWMWSAVTSGASAGAHAVARFFSWMATVVVNEVRALPGQVASLFSRLWASARSATSSGASSVKAAFSALWSALRSLVTSTVDTVVSIFRGLPGKAKAAVSSLSSLIKGVFSGAGNWLYSAGRDIVSGLVRGLKAATSGAVSAAANMAKSALAGAMKAIGAHSPSREFESKVGAQMVAGTVVGITRNAATVRAATVTMLRNAAVASTAVAGPAMASAGASMSQVKTSGAVRGGRQPQLVAHLYVDGEHIRTVVQRKTLQYARRNPTNGLNQSTGVIG